MEEGEERKEEGVARREEGRGARREEGRRTKEQGVGIEHFFIWHVTRHWSCHGGHCLCRASLPSPCAIDVRLSAVAVPHSRRRAPSPCASLPSPCASD